MSSRLENARIGIVGATGAVGTLTLRLLAERGFKNVRAFASSRSAGKELPFGDGKLVVEETTPEALRAGDLDLCLFSVGTSRSKEFVPHASAGAKRSAPATSTSASSPSAPPARRNSFRTPPPAARSASTSPRPIAWSTATRWSCPR